PPVTLYNSTCRPTFRRDRDRNHFAVETTRIAGPKSNLELRAVTPRRIGSWGAVGGWYGRHRWGGADVIEPPHSRAITWVKSGTKSLIILSLAPAAPSL